MTLQLQTELTYSKRQRNTLIVDGITGTLDPMIRMNMYFNLNKYRQQSYYKSKQKRIDMLPENDEIITNLIITIMASGGRKPIQGLATELGYALGYTDQIEAVKTGAELLSICHGDLYDIYLTEDSTEIVPKHSINEETMKRVAQLQFLPPMLQKPDDWTSNNNGGWLWEKKSVILGKGNHHEEYQAYDALNLLQSVPWTIDIPTYVDYENPNLAMNKDQYDRVITDYLGKEFYFVWRYDKRGRSYSSGYDLNVQSNEYGKAMLSLHNKQKVSRIENLKIAIANHAGHDRLTWGERIDWFNRQTTFDTESFDEPILGAKAIRAYMDTKQGYTTGYVMSLDATASGLQVMAALSGCRDTAKACNMVDTGNREDVYQMVADKMNSLLGVNDNVTRNDVKKPLMTTFYNSLANPRESFNKRQLEAFYETLDGLLPGAMAVMETINNFWDYDADVHSWELPDGHIARVPVTEMDDCRIEIDELDHRTFTYRYEKQKASTNHRSLVANIVHSVDGYVAREMVRRAHAQGIELVHIHDCFVFSPDYLQTTSQLYREIMAEIASSDLLSDILSELSNTYIPVEKLTDDLPMYILASDYMLS